MSTFVIASSETLMNSLRSSVLQCALPLHSAVLRTPGQALLPLLGAMDSGTLLLDSPPGHSGEDLTALEAWLHSRPRLNVLLLCEDHSKTLLQRAMRAGVREVLPLPPDPQDLAQSLGRWAINVGAAPANPALASSLSSAATGAAPPTGRLVAFMGCKGGNGTSFLAANMAHIIATEHQRSCAFVDLDLQCGDASFYLSSGAHQNTLSDLTRQIERLDQPLLASCLHAVTPHLNLLAAPHDMDSTMDITAADIDRVIQGVRRLHEQVVVDLPRNLNALSLKVLDQADRVYIVMQSTTPDVRDAQRLVNTLRALGVASDKLRLLVNRHANSGWVSLGDLESTLGMKVSQTLPDCPKWVGEAMHTGQALSQVNKRNGVMQALNEATSELLDMQPRQHRRWMPRWLNASA
jgi:pilus assembly protein CpaE